MANQQLLDYVKQQLQQNASKEQIKGSLMGNGWNENDVNEAFAIVSGNPIPPPQSPVSQQNLTATLPGATAIFSQAWSLYKQRFWIFVGIMIIPTVISILIGEIFGITTIYSKFTPGLFIILEIMLVYFAIFISFVWGQTALLFAIKDNQEKIGIKEAYKRGWSKILSYFWIAILAMFITMGGFLLLIVPGIIFVTWFSLAIFVLIAEDLKGMNALLKSREYVRGKWGSVFGRFFLIGTISIIIYLAVSLAFYFLKVPFGTQVASLINSLFILPFGLIYMFLFYRQIKVEKGEFVFAPTRGKKAIFICIGIFAILLPIIASVVLLGLNSAREKMQDAQPKIDLQQTQVSRDAWREADLQQIRFALELYYDNYRKYPFLLNELSPKYLPNIPIDPLTNQPYQYQLQTNGKDYQVCTELESTKTQKCITSQL